MAQIIPLRPEIMPLANPRVLDRPDILYLTMRDELRAFDAAEKACDDELKDLRMQEEYVRDRRLKVIADRAEAHTRRWDKERELTALIFKYPDLGE